MKTSPDLTRAIEWATSNRRTANWRKRDAGNPRKPFVAAPGMEEEYRDASADVRAMKLILKLLEKEAERERQERMRTKTAQLRRKIVRVLDRALDILIGIGLVLLGALGVAAALLLLRAPDLATRTAAVMGVIVALARTVIAAGK